MRLVPNQNADNVFKKYSAFVKKHTPKGIETKITVHSKGPACVVGTDNPYIKAATEALHDTLFKKETVFIRSGGSMPIVTDFRDVPENSQRNDGLRPPRRQPPCPQRKVPHPQLPQRHRNHRPLLQKLGEK